MKNIEEIRLLLYRSFDQTLTKKEQKRLEAALHESETLRIEKEEAVFLRQQLSDWSPPISGSVIDKVMDVIESENNIDRYYFKVFNKVLLTGIAAVILLLLSIWLTEGNLTYDTLAGIAGYQPETEMIWPLSQ